MTDDVPGLDPHTSWKGRGSIDVFSEHLSPTGNAEGNTIKAPQAVKLARPRSDLDFKRVITKVVAGAGFEPATFRL